MMDKMIWSLSITTFILLATITSGSFDLFKLHGVLKVIIFGAVCVGWILINYNALEPDITRERNRAKYGDGYMDGK